MEKVNFKNQLLVHLSTVAVSKCSYRSWVNIQSARTEEVILDKNRCELIEKQLAPAIQAFLTGSMPLAEFKTEIDSINKQNTLWEFSGIKGQMFFNLLFNACTDEAELTAELTAAISLLFPYSWHTNLGAPS
jgi:hypothetical protein